MAEINITPFTDVVLVLLVIFMIVTPLLTQNNVKISLPTAKTRETDQRPLKIVVQISEQGTFFIEQQSFSSTNVVDMARFAETFSSRSTPDSSVIIRADRNCRYALVMQVVDLAKQSGFRRVVLAGESPR